MKLTKQDTRLRRARRGRAKIKELAAMRLSVHRTPQHIYAQIFAPEGDKVLVAASTLQKDVRGELKTTGNIEAAKAVGRAIAERAKDIVLGYRQFSARDAVHLAVMEHHRIERILTFDSGFDGFPGITRLS